MSNSEKEKNFACLTDIGKKRKNNEDAAYAASSQYGKILIIADGMGGHRKGEVASKMVIDELSLAFYSVRKKLTVSSARKLVRKHLKKANKDIYKLSLNGEDYKEMGTTAVCAVICQDGTYIISIGDSRCYTYSDNSGLVRKTTDQTYVELLFETGKITRAEIANHPQKNLLINAIGINPDLSQIQENTFSNDSYDCLLLCSDGLYNGVSEEEMTDILKNKETSAHEKAKALIDTALSHDENDNIAVSIWENTQDE